jgi:hypothetical protein
MTRRTKKMNRNESYAVEPFLNGTSVVDIGDGFVIFADPVTENGKSVIRARVPGLPQIYRFRQKSNWTLPDGKKSRWYVLTDSSILDEAHNFIIKGTAEVNEDGSVRRFDSHEFVVADYDPALSKAVRSAAECFIPEQERSEVFRNALKNSGDPGEVIAKETAVEQ